MKRDDIFNVLIEGIYTKPETIKSLMVDFLTLKALLVSKGLITEDELTEIRPMVERQLDMEVLEKIKAMNKENPSIGMFIDLLTGVFKKKEEKNGQG